MLDLQLDANIKSGMSPGEALRAGEHPPVLRRHIGRQDRGGYERDAPSAPDTCGPQTTCRQAQRPKPSHHRMLTLAWTGSGAFTCVIRSWFQVPSTLKCAVAPSSKASIMLWFT